MRSIKNKNPLNVKVSNMADPWIGSSTWDEDEHSIFIDELFSIRAAIYILARYQESGCSTLSQVFAKYAPTSDGNDPIKYASFVAGRMGIAVNDDLMLFNEDLTILNKTRIHSMISAMIEYENFTGYQKLEAVENGIAYYKKAPCRRRRDL